MRVEKYLLSEFTDTNYPTRISYAPEGTSLPSSPTVRGEGLVSDGTYLYHVDRNQYDNGVRRIALSPLASELAAIQISFEASPIPAQL